MVSQIRTSFLFKMRLPTRPAPSRVSDESCRRPPRGPPRAVMAARLRDLGLAEHRSLGRPYSYFILLWLPHRGCLGADPICPVSLRDRLHCFQCFLLSLRRNSHNTNFTLCSVYGPVVCSALTVLCKHRLTPERSFPHHTRVPVSRRLIPQQVVPGAWRGWTGGVFQCGRHPWCPRVGKGTVKNRLILK